MATYRVDPRSRQKEKGFIQTVLMLYFLLFSAPFLFRFPNIVYLLMQGISVVPSSSTGVEISASEPAAEEKSDTQYRLVGSDVIKISGSKTSVFIKNVTEVSEVTAGPDGNTIHFKNMINVSDKDNDQLTCINIGLQVKKFRGQDGDWVKALPPWDYPMLSEECNNMQRAGGYLRNSDYFVYLRMPSPTEGYIYYKDLKTSQLRRVSVNPELLKGFSDGSKDPSSGRVNSYWDEPVYGSDGSQYFYPQRDAYLQSKNLVLAIGTLVLVIDTQSNTLLGGYVQKGVVYTSFWFETHNQLPFAVIQAAWEGPMHKIGILDASNNRLTSVTFSDLGLYTSPLFVKESFTWEGDGALFYFTDDEDASGKLPESYSFERLPIDNPQKMTDINNQAREYLIQNFGYIDAYCSLGPGQTSGCVGLKQRNTYEYTPLKGLVKL